MTSVDEFVHWARTTSVKSIIPQRHLIYVVGDMPMMQLLKKFKEHRIYSLPVINPNLGKVLGMISVIDIAFAIYELADLGRYEQNGHFDPGDVAAAFIDVQPLRKKLQTTPIAPYIRKASASRSETIQRLPASFEGPTLPECTVLVSDTIEDLMTKLGWDSRRRVPVVHRVDLIETNNSFRRSRGSSFKAEDIHDFTPEEHLRRASLPADENPESPGFKVAEMLDVVSQSDLLKFMYQHMDKLPEHILSMSIKGVTTHKLCTVAIISSMAEALYLFRTKKVLSIIVQDLYKGFVAVLSVHDFAARATDLSIYGMAVDEFFASEDKAWRESAKGKAILVAPNITIKEAIKQIVENNQTRLWISDPVEVSPHSKKPIISGVLSIRDLIIELWRAFPENAARLQCED